MRKICLLLFSLLVIYSCSDFYEYFDQSDIVEEVSETALTRATAGSYTTLPNPFALDVMQDVYDTYSLTTVNLRATHYYIRFLPADADQLDMLENSLNLELFDYPLDIEIPEGVEYVDPTIPEGSYGWQYTTIPVQKNIPTGIQYEIL